MTRLAVFALLLSSSFASAVDPDPAKLKPTAEQSAKAEALVKRLGSDIFRERDNATRELEEMGRLALAAIDRALAETGNAEVRTRCEALRPAMANEELKARLEAFNADLEGKYDHKLPGWEKFAKITGNTSASRKLFSDLYENAPTARILAATTGPKEDLSKMTIERRIELYNRMYGRNRVIAINGAVQTSNERQPPTVAELAGLLFAEGLLGSVSDRRYVYAIQSMVYQSPARELIQDEAKGEALRKLVANWCDTRTDTSEQYYAMTMATTLNVKEIPAVKYALRILDAKNGIMSYKAMALTTLAKAGKEQLPNLVKYFDDKTVYMTLNSNVNGVMTKTEFQVRDLALAMAVIVSDEKIEDYGIATMRPATEAMKYSTNLYKFTDDAKRMEAFKKWAEKHGEQK